jgi:SAM-dependent methyltransferase
MEDKYINNWHRVWSKRSVTESGSGTVLEKLISADGFDSPLGLMEENDWRDYVSLLAKRIQIVKDESIFEVGCGAGAFLYPFYQVGHQVSGIDYSKELVNIALESMPLDKESLQVMEATSCNAEPPYDVIFANHVIHYFPSLDYVSDVMNIIFKKVKRIIAISGIPNTSMKDESEKMRKGLLTDKEYELKYKGLEILYFDKGWFEVIAEKAGFSVEFFKHEMPGFAQNQYRFDCVFVKKELSNDNQN